MTDPGPAAPIPLDDPLESRPLPPAFLWSVVALSALPVVLHTLFGVDLGVPASSAPLTTETALYERLRGAFIHTILESGAIGVGGMTGLLAIARYRIRGGVAAPILVLAFFYGGVVDATHTLVSDHLVQGRAPLAEFMAFSWSVGRLFNASILLIGVIALVSTQSRTDRLRPTRFVLSWAIAFGVLTILVVAFLLEAHDLPGGVARVGWLPRPWDLLPLAVYAVIAGLALPLLAGERRSPFVQAVWASMIPAIGAQAHMAFGSTALFDHDFNAAHGLKILAYAVPFAGLAIDYRSARAAERRAIAEKTQAEVERAQSERRVTELRAMAGELERSNRDLEQFAYVASHDLRAPLRAVRNLTTWLEEDFGEALSDEGREYIGLIHGRVRRLEDMISSLLEFSRVGRGQEPPVQIDPAVLTRELWDMLDAPDRVSLRLGTLPVVRADPVRLRQVLQNLLSNAARFADTEVRLSASTGPGAWTFEIADDGPGIEPRYQERIWDLFGRLEARDVEEGTGLGLALVRRAVRLWGGEAWVRSTPGEGAVFSFTLPFEAQRPGTPVPLGDGPEPPGAAG